MSAPEQTLRASVLRVRMSLLEPFVTGFGATPVRTTVVVRLEDSEGHIGWGEAPALDHPFYLPETTSGTYAVIEEYALPLALACGSDEPGRVAKALSVIRGNGFARAGVEAAYWSLRAARTERTLAGLFGGVRDRIAVGESLSIKESIDQTLAEVAGRIDEGYRRIKLKIRHGWDVEVVRAVRESFPALVLTVDANASYSLDDVETFIRLDEFGLLCIEQPLGYDDIEGSARLQARLTTPVCLDEAITSPRAARLAIDNDACRNVNLKPSRVGGVTAAREIHDLCVERGIPLWCGGMLESGIGRASNIALCSLPGFVQPADMSPAHVLYTEDLVDPTFDIDTEGYVAVPTMPGLGFDVALDRLRDRTIQQSDWDPHAGRMVPSLLEPEGVR